MIVHVVVFTFNEGTTTEQVDAITSALRALPPQIPELLGYDVGPDLGLNPDTGDYAVVARVADEAGLRAYTEHPAHQDAVAKIRAVAKSRAAVQMGAA